MARKTAPALSGYAEPLARSVRIRRLSGFILLTSQSGISPPFLRALRCDVRADTVFAAVPTSPQCRKIARIIIWVSPAPGTCSAVPYYVISGLSRSLAASGSLDRRRCAAHVQTISIPNMPQGLGPNGRDYATATHCYGQQGSEGFRYLNQRPLTARLRGLNQGIRFLPRSCYLSDFEVARP